MKTDAIAHAAALPLGAVRRLGPTFGIAMPERRTCRRFRKRRVDLAMIIR